ncbi:MAG: ABC transporter permease [Chryseosolibacter sp.]
MLKIITLAIAFASSFLVILFCLNEFGYDRFHKDPDTLFRILRRNTDEEYSGNRLSTKIPAEVVHQLKAVSNKSFAISRIKIMKEVTLISGDETFRNQKIHAADPSISAIFSFEIIDGDSERFTFSDGITGMISSRAAQRYMGTSQAAGKKIRLYSSSDTIEVRIAAVFKDFPKNSHEDFDIFIVFDPSVIRALDFDPSETGVYGRALNARPEQYESSVSRIAADTKATYLFQPLTQLYFGPRVLGEDARHGDSYSITILICITALILFLALTSFVNLTTLTLPYRSKELAVKKLAGISHEGLLYTFLKESFLLVGISLAVGLLVLIFTGAYIKPILGLGIPSLLFAGDPMLIQIIAATFVIFVISPVFMSLRFINATPSRLLSTDTITFPTFKRVITFLQLGIGIFLIVASLVVRRQITYSLLKEPGRNHDQVVYLNCPSGITNEGIFAMRSNWKKFNPNIIDVMAVSQLPDRISSKEIGSEFYSLGVDPGFREFFDLKMTEGNWFKVNDGDSVIVTNKNAKEMMGKDNANVIGVIEDLSERFNQPGKPVKISLARDFNYNWLCVRVLEVDIRRTVNRLSDEFSSGAERANVHFLNKHFEDWLGYQDRLNALSGILALISALLSCCAIYGLSVSLVRDKLKQIAIHKLYGAHTAHITRLLVMEFAREMLIALIVFALPTYIFLNELLRTFTYATKLNWLDPVYPIVYCALIITALCGFQALRLNRSDLTSALKG